MSIVESAALCGFVFFVAPHVGPPAAILMLSGIYIFTGFLGINCCCCHIDEEDTPSHNRDEGILRRRLRRCWNGSTANFVGTIFQLLGLLGALAVTCYLEYSADPSITVFDLTTLRWRSLLRLTITAILIPVILSLVWSRMIQKLIHRCSNATPAVDGYSSLPSNSSLNQQLAEMGGKIAFLKASRRGGVCMFPVSLIHISLVYSFMHTCFVNACGQWHASLPTFLGEITPIKTYVIS